MQEETVARARGYKEENYMNTTCPGSSPATLATAALHSCPRRSADVPSIDHVPQPCPPLAPRAASGRHRRPRLRFCEAETSGLALAISFWDSDFLYAQAQRMFQIYELILLLWFCLSLLLLHTDSHMCFQSYGHPLVF